MDSNPWVDIQPINGPKWLTPMKPKPTKIRPTSPSLNTLEMRSASFANSSFQWPHKHPAPQAIIDAGFKYAPTATAPDSVICHTCTWSLWLWEKSDDPYEEHLKNSPECEWLKKHHEALMLARKHACRRCSAKFPSNTKLHDHVRDHHTRKPTNENTPPTVTLATSPTPPTSPPSAPSAPVSPPQTPVAKPSAPATLSLSPITPIAFASPSPAPASPPAPTTTPRKPISWAEIASLPKPTKPSRLPRLTVKYGLPTPPPSPVLLPQEPTNQITKRPSTPAVRPYLTMEDLYTMFHEKPRPSSFNVSHTNSDDVNSQKTRKWKPIPNLLPGIQMLQKSANHIAKRPSISASTLPTNPPGLHQMRITSYFKPATNSPTPLPPTLLASNRKHADLKTPGKSLRNRDLAPPISPASASHLSHRICRRCKQHFITGNMLHRHLQHCIAGTKR